MTGDSSSTNYFLEDSAFSNWLSVADPTRQQALLAEDSGRNDRLAVLNEVIGLPVIGSVSIPGEDVLLDGAETRALRAAVLGHRMAVRIKDLASNTVTDRNRNLDIDALISWLRSSIGNKLLGSECEFSEHIPNEWAVILVVTPDAIVGEVAQGTLRRLTQGGAGGGEILNFEIPGNVHLDGQAAHIIAMVLDKITVTDGTQQAELEARLQARFDGSDRLVGYFEAVAGPGEDVRFIDYNRKLAEQLTDRQYSAAQVTPRQLDGPSVMGICASVGSSTGPARVFIHESPQRFRPGDMVVCVEPTPALIPFLRDCAGLICDGGGVLSHASILCRELHLPCIVGTGHATELFVDGDEIRLDASAGYAVHVASGEA